MIIRMEEGSSEEAAQQLRFQQDLEEESRTLRIRVKNRRKRYLDLHPAYFSPSLELADPLLYDRLIRRFQTPTEREVEGRSKGYSGILEADLMRSEAKVAALAHPSSTTMTYKRGPNGEIYPEEKDEVPANKEDGAKRWRREMELRFIRGDDEDFDYEAVDQSEEWDNRAEEDREEEEKYFAQEEPSWVLDDKNAAVGMGQPIVKGETGIQDF
ncbi:MAG: hypothetical protein M1827_004529 [Pycnora praestabilis]|nr:MAG: hypothetical protein M1827_004529 [Pycnora praestabilis]